MNKHTLGWNHFFQQQFLSYQFSGLEVGRIASENRNSYTVFSDHGILLAEVTGKLLYTSNEPADLPKVGDWVLIQVYPNEDKAIIHQVLERKSKFSRKVPGRRIEEQIIAANIDLVFIVQSLDQNFNLRRLERMTSFASEGGARPVIILSKEDLCENVEEKLTGINASAPGISVIVTSSFNNSGIAQLNDFLKPGITGAFIGSSGVGKSTLINKIIGEDMQETREVRITDSKGRHTTTRREMFLCKNGGLIIDTPGMREFQLWQDEETLQDSFSDIGKYSKECFYSNCQHQSEIRCAVKAAIARGDLSYERFNNFIKMQKELQYLAVANNPQKREEKKKAIKKAQKAFNKIIRKNDL